jgi:transcriptional regulator with XRE-family HTH domain
MKKKAKHKLTDQLRQIIADSGMTMGEVSRAAGIDKTGLSRFLSGERGVSAKVLDKIGALYGLRFTIDKPNGKECK